jgi:hypothetical protein
MLGLTDAVQLRGGPGTLAGDDGEVDEILVVTFRTRPTARRAPTRRRRRAVATLFVHHRLWPIGTQGDPFDFTHRSQARSLARARDRAAGSGGRPFRFTLDHPSAASRCRS